MQQLMGLLGGFMAGSAAQTGRTPRHTPSRTPSHPQSARLSSEPPSSPVRIGSSRNLKRSREPYNPSVEEWLQNLNNDAVRGNVKVDYTQFVLPLEAKGLIQLSDLHGLDADLLQRLLAD